MDVPDQTAEIEDSHHEASTQDDLQDTDINSLVFLLSSASVLRLYFTLD